MKRFAWWIGAMTVAAAPMAMAQPGDAGARPGRGAEMRERMLKEFDADGDGELNEEERAKARESRMGRQRGEGRGERGGPGGPGGPGGRPEGRGGPGGGQMMNPERMFTMMDADGDGSITKEEFMKGFDSMRAMRGPGGPPAGGPPRGEGRGEGRGDRRGRGPGGERPDRPAAPPADDTAADEI